jgi:hypothetical protein
MAENKKRKAAGGAKKKAKKVSSEAVDIKSMEALIISSAENANSIVDLLEICEQTTTPKTKEATLQGTDIPST